MVPCVQAVQAVRPTVAATVLLTQCVHADVLVFPDAKPIAHAVQTEEPGVPLYFPAAQL